MDLTIDKSTWLFILGLVFCLYLSNVLSRLIRALECIEDLLTKTNERLAEIQYDLGKVRDSLPL
jgi:hypothetical protein